MCAYVYVSIYIYICVWVRMCFCSSIRILQEFILTFISPPRILDPDPVRRTCPSQPWSESGSWSPVARLGGFFWHPTSHGNAGFVGGLGFRVLGLPRCLGFLREERVPTENLRSYLGFNFRGCSEFSRDCRVMVEASLQQMRGSELSISVKICLLYSLLHKLSARIESI